MHSYTINYGLFGRRIVPVFVDPPVSPSFNTRDLFSPSLHGVSCPLHLPLPGLLLFLRVVHLPQFVEHVRDELDLVLNGLDLDSLLTRHVEVPLILNDLQVSDLQVLLQLIQLIVILLKQ